MWILAAVLTLSATIAQAATFAGHWTTTYGDMTLEESSGAIRGNYRMGDALCDIEGRQDGEMLTFTYKEPNASGEGSFQLASGGTTFEGRWRQRGQQAWQPWRGARRRPKVEAATFGGLWDSSFGRLRLVQEGPKVSGLYAFSNGTLAGSVDKGTFKFTYEDTAKGEGEFRLAPQGRALSGRWRQSGTKEWKPWEAVRIEPLPGRRWLYVIEAPWEQSIAEREYSYGEMLKVFFTRTPHVQVRQRSFTDRKSLIKWLREANFLAEPVIVYISSHGSLEGPTADDGAVGAAPIAAALAGASSVQLLHFGACEVMKGRVAQDIHAKLGETARVPISGFTETVDWAASALTDFMYLDLILAREFDPERAAEETARLMPFAKTAIPGAPFGSIGFILRKP